MNDYVMSMRKLIGKEMLLTVGCGAIIEDSEGRILLQRRKDQNNWCIPGGVMDIGEMFEETCKREVIEETNLNILNLRLFGIYSGKEGIKEYPNGDKIFSVQIIFYTKDYEGVLKSEGDESFEHGFFGRSELPSPLNSAQERFILDWKNGVQDIVVK